MMMSPRRTYPGSEPLTMIVVLFALARRPTRHQSPRRSAIPPRPPLRQVGLVELPVAPRDLFRPGDELARGEQEARGAGHA